MAHQMRNGSSSSVLHQERLRKSILNRWFIYIKWKLVMWNWQAAVVVLHMGNYVVEWLLLWRGTFLRIQWRGTYWKCNVHEGKIVQHPKSVILHRSTTRFRDLKGGIMALNDEYFATIHSAKYFDDLLQRLFRRPFHYVWAVEALVAFLDSSVLARLEETVQVAVVWLSGPSRPVLEGSDSAAHDLKLLGFSGIGDGHWGNLR